MYKIRSKPMPKELVAQPKPLRAHYKSDGVFTVRRGLDAWVDALAEVFDLEAERKAILKRGQPTELAWTRTGASISKAISRTRG